MKLYVKTSELHDGIVVFAKQTAVDCISPMEAYRLADELTDAADRLLSQDARQLPASPKTQ